MKQLLPCLFAFFLLSPFIGQSQDMNWTQFYFSPLSVNPANTGNFLGTYRLGGIARDASFAITNSSSIGNTNIFKSASAHIDAPINLGFRKGDWIGVGGMFFYDVAGAGNLGLNYSLLSVAYHFSLNRKQTNIFTIGIQAGMGGRKLGKPENLNFEDDSQMGLPLMSGGMGNEGKASFLDLNFGVGYRSQVNKQTKINIGATVNQLSFADQALIMSNNNQGTGNIDSTLIARRPLGLGLHGTFDFMLNKQWDLSPSFRVQTFGPAREMQLQGVMGYKINKDKDTKLKFGLGYRIGDAAQVILGMDFKDVRVGLAYDISLSSITAVDNSFGGIEIGVSYIGKIFKEPKIKPVILCPRY